MTKYGGGGYTFSIKKRGKFLNVKKPHVLYRLWKTGENRPVFAVFFSVFRSMIFNSTLFIAIQLLVEPHSEYEKFNTDEYRKQVFSMFGGELCNVTLLFEPSILSDMFDRFGDDIRIRKVDDNAYSVDVSVQVSKTLFAWIVGTQGKVKIRSPRKVLDEFNNFVAKIKEEY